MKRKQLLTHQNDDHKLEPKLLRNEASRDLPFWPNTSSPLKLTVEQLKMPKKQWTWVTVAEKDDIPLSEDGTTNFAVKYGLSVGRIS